MKTKKVIVALCFFVLCFGIFYLPGTIKNWTLISNEIKAYFKTAVSLNYYPEIDMVKEIQIGGAITMSSYDLSKHGNAVYIEKRHIEQITDYLNEIKLVGATEDELPNMSPDAFVQYFNAEGLVRNFTIYGQVFVRDATNNKLYRLKETKEGIIEGLENVKFN